MRSEEGDLVRVFIDNCNIHLDTVIVAFASDQRSNFAIDTCTATVIELASCIFRRFWSFSLGHYGFGSGNRRNVKSEVKHGNQSYLYHTKLGFPFRCYLNSPHLCAGVARAAARQTPRAECTDPRAANRFSTRINTEQISISVFEIREQSCYNYR
jgi:hypothetical protein